MTQQEMNTHRADVDRAFKQALATGRLSLNESAANYVGAFMYMGPRADGRGDAFKHSLTREYLA